MKAWRLLHLHPSCPPFSKPLQTAAAVAISAGEPPPISAADFSPRARSSPSHSNPLTHFPAAQSLTSAAQIHAHLFKSAHALVPPHRNRLITLYSKCRLPNSARNLFDEIPHPDLVSFSALISALAHNSLPLAALVSFKKMRSLSLGCNEFALPTLIKAACDFATGSQLHALAILTGFESDVFVANTLVVMYANFGRLSDSTKLFDSIPDPNAISWNALLVGFVRNERFEEAVGILGEMVESGVRPTEYGFSSALNACSGARDLLKGRVIHGYLTRLGYDSDRFTANAMVDMYAKVGDVEAAAMVFGEIDSPDLVSWNAFIAGCVLNGHDRWALAMLMEMRCSGMVLNVFTLSSILKACAGTGVLDLGRQVHGNLIKAGCDLDSFVGVGLIDMYAKWGFTEDAKKAFRLFGDHDLILWNALISGYSHNGSDEEALSFFSEMRNGNSSFNRTTLSAVLKSAASLQSIVATKQIHALSIRAGFEPDAYVANGLIDSYGKCGSIEDAEVVLEQCPIRDVVSFTSMITAYFQSGKGEEAMKLFVAMKEKKLDADSFICSSLLNACASLSAYEQGKQVHVHLLKLGFMSDAFVGNALVNMYAKCGSIEDATLTFSEIPERGVVSWSAMIGGLAQHGHGRDALGLFDDMVDEGVAPNHITLTSVLCACNHAGLVDEAEEYFESMGARFGILQTQEHYACMIDVLGRAGRLDAAMELVNRMPFEANAAVWGALLGASRVHGDVNLGSRAAEMLFKLEPEKSGTHVLLANIYASKGMWDGVASTRRLMKDNRVKKEPGVSWIELRDKVHTFVVGDRSHERAKEIYAKLDQLGELMSRAGYVPMVEFELHDVEQSEKEMLLLHHSEKLAVAFGLISTPAGVPIRVKKNLRVCRDCHTAFKYICTISSREIIIRDINRFHHFKDGSCSCGDYW